MQPYQAFKRGLITYEEYLTVKGRTNIDPDEVRSISVIMTSSMNLGGGESWNVLSGESTIGYIGPSADLVNEGTVNIAGDVLFYCDTKGLDNRGDINITTGSLQFKEA